MKKPITVLSCLAVATLILAFTSYLRNANIIRSDAIIQYDRGSIQFKEINSIVRVSRIDKGDNLMPDFSSYSRWYAVKDGKVALWVYSGDIGIYLIKPKNGGADFSVETITTGNISSFKQSMPDGFIAGLPHTIKQYID